MSKTFVRFRIYKRRLTGHNQFIGETLLRNSLIDAKNGCLTHHTLLLHSKTDANVGVFNGSKAIEPWKLSSQTRR